MTEIFKYSEYRKYPIHLEAHKRPCKYGELPLFVGKCNIKQSIINSEPKNSPFTRKKSPTSLKFSLLSLSDAEKHKTTTEYGLESFQQSLSDAEREKTRQGEMELLMKQYTRVSPEFFELLQQKGKHIERTIVKPSKVQVPQFALRHDPTALDHTNPQLAAYLRTVMEPGGITNTLFGVDFYNNYADTSQDVNPEHILYLLKQLEGDGSLSPDQLSTLINAFGSLSPDDLARLLEFLQASGVLTPEMLRFLQQLMQRSGGELTPQQLAMILDALEKNKRAQHRNSVDPVGKGKADELDDILGDAKRAGGSWSTSKPHGFDGSGHDQLKKAMKSGPAYGDSAKGSQKVVGINGGGLGKSSNHAAFIRHRTEEDGGGRGTNKWDAVVVRDKDFLTDGVGSALGVAGDKSKKGGEGPSRENSAFVDPATGDYSKKGDGMRGKGNARPVGTDANDKSKNGGRMHGSAMLGSGNSNSMDAEIDDNSKKSGRTRGRGKRNSPAAGVDSKSKNRGSMESDFGDKSKKGGTLRGNDNQDSMVAATASKSKKGGGVDDRGNTDDAKKGLKIDSGGRNDNVTTDADKSKKAGGFGNSEKRNSMVKSGADREKNAGGIDNSGTRGFKNEAAYTFGSGAADGGETNKGKKGGGKYTDATRSGDTAANAKKFKKSGRFDSSGNRSAFSALKTTADDDRAKRAHRTITIGNRAATVASSDGTDNNRNVNRVAAAADRGTNDAEARVAANDVRLKKSHGSATAGSKDKARRLLNAMGNKRDSNRRSFKPDKKKYEKQNRFSREYSDDSMEFLSSTSYIEPRVGIKDRKRVTLRRSLSPQVPIASNGRKHPLYYEPWDVDNFYNDLPEFTHLAQTARQKRVRRHSDMDYMELKISKFRPSIEIFNDEDQNASKTYTGKNLKKPKKQNK